ncbi:MAG TPA: ABC transporter permease [Gemmatales bacterium]|nr:ABC transporter permease [Gemmatales bacterium]
MSFTYIPATESTLNTTATTGSAAHPALPRATKSPSGAVPRSAAHADTNPTPTDHLPVTRIGPRPPFGLHDLRQLWQFRELLYYLAWRDVAIRYKQSVLGVAWALIQPLSTMLVFAVFLGRLGGISAGIPHYALFVFAGVVPWTFFANAVTASGMSVLSNERLITKIYFPRLIIPIAAIGAPFFDFLVSLSLMVLMMVWYQVVPGWGLLLLPYIVLMLFLAAVGFGCFLSALIVAQRDFKFILNFGIQLWMFAPPCISLGPASFGPLAHRWLPLNPAYGLILNFRQALLGEPIEWYALAVSSAVTLAVLLVGLLYFRRIERTFADVI